MKNINFSILDKNGQIIKTVYCSEDVFDLYVKDAYGYCFGIHNQEKQYVENGEVVDMPPKPSEDYIFDYNSKQWVIDLKGAERKALAKRDQLLSSGPDRVNPMWWSSMTATEQSEVSAYRQSLLDITNQSGYPMNIEWPEIPSVFKG